MDQVRKSTELAIIQRPTGPTSQEIHRTDLARFIQSVREEYGQGSVR